MRRTILSLLAVSILASGALVAEEDGPAPWEDAETTKTRHYRMKTNCEEEVAERVAERLELFYKTFFRTFRRSAVKLHDVRNLPVFLFARREEYREYMNGFKPAVADNAGYYDTETGKIYAYERGEETFETLLHEGTHQLVNLAANGCRTRERPGFWIEEGLADYFAGMTFKDGELEPGLREDRRARIRRMLAADSLIPLEEFVNSPRGPRGWSLPQYGEGCVLTHFFLHARKGRLRRPFLEYVKVVLQSRGQTDTFEEAFRCKASTFEEEFEAFARELAGVEEEK